MLRDQRRRGQLADTSAEPCAQDGAEAGGFYPAPSEQGNPCPTGERRESGLRYRRGTERRIIRPGDADVQRQFYSGKKHCHTLKNNLVVGLDDMQIKGLSGTHEGKKHDKKICDEEGVGLPEGSNLYQDSGFQGQKLVGVTIHQPKKKPRGGELTDEEKASNRLISRIRVVVEHVIAGGKRCRIVQDVFRNTLAGYDDKVMDLACGLHNFRSYQRRMAY